MLHVVQTMVSNLKTTCADKFFIETKKDSAAENNVNNVTYNMFRINFVKFIYIFLFYVKYCHPTWNNLRTVHF